jgi:hypothetical protein
MDSVGKRVPQKESPEFVSVPAIEAGVSLPDC